MHPQSKHYKYLSVFVAAFVTCYLVQGILLNRLIDLGGYYITGGTFIYFLSPLISDVVTEVYGYKIARQLVWLGLGTVVFMTICINICIRLPTPEFWVSRAEAYSIALSSLFRATVVGIITILVGQFVNIYLVSKWKILTKGKYFWLRSVGASIIGDSLTVSLSILLIFSGRIPIQSLMPMLIPELTIMLLFTALGGIPATIVAKLTAKAEGLQAYDVGVDFNPFKFKIG